VAELTPVLADPGHRTPTKPDLPALPTLTLQAWEFRAFRTARP
jgi:hypothetical protein